MKNLLFLAGLIMVTAACSSGSSGTNMTTSENDKEANISFVYLGVSKKMYGELLYSLCQASYNDDTKELCLEITGNEDASLTYSCLLYTSPSPRD